MFIVDPVIKQQGQSCTRFGHVGNCHSPSRLSSPKS